MMFSTDFLKPITKPSKIFASRPVFHSSSAFIDDEDDLRKPSPLPLFNKRTPADTTLRITQPGLASRFQLILHVLNTILSFASASLFISAIPIWNANFEHTRSIVAGDYTDGLVLVPLLLSTMVSVYILLTEHAPAPFRLQPRFGHSSTIPKQTGCTPLGPSKRVLLSLTIVLVLAPALTLSATNSLALLWKAPIRSKNGLIVCNLSNIFSRPCQPILYQVGGIQIGGIVAGSLTWFIWIIVLAGAIRFWARDRKEKQEAAKARRRKRHERRRGHGHEDRHEHKYKHRHRHGNNSDLHHHRNRLGGLGSQAGDSTKLPVRVESRAAQTASQKVRPQQTIQVWLNDRYV